VSAGIAENQSSQRRSQIGHLEKDGLAVEFAPRSIFSGRSDPSNTPDRF